MSLQRHGVKVECLDDGRSKGYAQCIMKLMEHHTFDASGEMTGSVDRANGYRQ